MIAITILLIDTSLAYDSSALDEILQPSILMLPPLYRSMEILALY